MDKPGTVVMHTSYYLYIKNIRKLQAAIETFVGLLKVWHSLLQQRFKTRCRIILLIVLLYLVKRMFKKISTISYHVQYSSTANVESSSKISSLSWFLTSCSIL
jgi:hypothetical protein